MNGRPAGIGIEDKLSKPIAIPQINKNQSTVVAIRMDPAGQPDRLGDIARANLAAGVRAVTRLDSFHG
jgi:hypothetical protein